MKRLLVIPLILFACLLHGKSYGAAMSSYPTASSLADGDKTLISKSTASNATQQAAMSTIKNYVLSDVIDFSVTAPITYSSGVFSIATNTYHPYDPYLFSWPDTISRDEVLYLNGLTGNIQSQINALNVGTIPFLTSDPTSPADDYAWINTTDASFNWADSTGINKILATHTAWDTTIDAISFTPVTGATIGGAQVTSDVKAIAGINHPSTISVSGDIGAAYKINSGSIVNSPGTVVTGDSVTAYVNPSGTGSTETVATLTIGGVGYLFSVTTVAPVSYLLESRFEDATDRNLWTASGTVDKAFPATGLSMKGSAVARIDAVGSITRPLTSPASEVYMILPFRYEDALETAEYNIVIRDSGNSTLAQVVFSPPGNGPKISDGIITSGYVTTPTMAPDTTFWIKIRYKAGTGADGILSISSWSGTAWNAPVSILTSTKTANAHNILLRNTQDGVGVEYWYFDNVFVSSVDITGDPNAL